MILFNKFHKDNYMKNYEATNNPDFWKQYEWGQNLNKNNNDIIENRNKFIIHSNIDTERKLDPRYYPEGWTSVMFNRNGNGVSSSGEIFYIKDSDNMIMVISIYNYSLGHFKFKDWDKLSYPLYNKSTTYYKIAPHVFTQFSEESDDITDL